MTLFKDLISDLLKFTGFFKLEITHRGMFLKESGRSEVEGNYIKILQLICRQLRYLQEIHVI